MCEYKKVENNWVKLKTVKKTLNQLISVKN